MEGKIRKAKFGDKSSVVFIINKYKKYILKKAWKFNIPGYDFEDLVQHGYLSVIKAINKYKLGSNSYNSYFLKSIDTNFCALLRGEIKHFREVPDDNIISKDKKYDFTLEDEIAAYDEILKLRQAIKKLNQEEREIIEKHYLMDMSYKEIAADLDMSFYHVRYLKDKGFNRLRKTLYNRKEFFQLVVKS